MRKSLDHPLPLDYARPSLQRTEPFTLFDCLLALVVLLVVAAVVFPKFRPMTNYGGRFARGATREALDEIALGLDTFRKDVGHYPGREEGIVALWARPAGEASWRGPYLRRPITVDSWMRPIAYKHVPVPKLDREDYLLYSVGADGVDGSRDDVTPSVPHLPLPCGPRSPEEP